MKKPIIQLVIFYLLFIILLIGCSYLFSSCQVLKKKSSVTSDSTAVNKIDSGAVNITTIQRKDSSAWWREILTFGRDTTIINPVTNVYPTSYIREGGVRTIETKEINYDSLWSNKIDSLVVKLSRTDKSKETKVLGFWQILAIAAGVCIVFLLISKLKIGII